MIAHNESYWYIAFAASNVQVWKRIVKRLESITRRFDRTLSSFMLAVCTSDDPVPPGGLGIGRVKRLFQINEAWFVQVTHDKHPYWIQVWIGKFLTEVKITSATTNSIRGVEVNAKEFKAFTNHNCARMSLS